MDMLGSPNRSRYFIGIASLRGLVEVVRLDGEGGLLKEKLPVSFEGLELLPVVGGFGGEGLIVDVRLILGDSMSKVREKRSTSKSFFFY